MTFADVELQLNNLGLSLNSDLTVTVSTDEEAEDAMKVVLKQCEQWAENQDDLVA